MKYLLIENAVSYGFDTDEFPVSTSNKVLGLFYTRDEVIAKVESELARYKQETLESMADGDEAMEKIYSTYISNATSTVNKNFAEPANQMVNLAYTGYRDSEFEERISYEVITIL
jgi:hypothetical protein